MHRILTFALAVLLCFLCVCSGGKTAPDIFPKLVGAPAQTAPALGTREITTAEGVVISAVTQFDSSHGRVDCRRYVFENGDEFLMKELTASKPVEAGTAVETLTLRGSTGTLRYYIDGNRTVTELPDSFTLPSGVVFLDTDEESLMIYAPQAYYPRANDEREWLPKSDGSVEIVRKDGAYQISIRVGETPVHSLTDYLYLRSHTPLVDPETPRDDDPPWRMLLVILDNRWCYNGYYYRTPSTYYPTGEQYFHRIPSPYIVTRAAVEGTGIGARAFVIAMYDVMLELQNEDGYFPTNAGSMWLYEDYGIGPGFYDTRFSTDLAGGLLTAYKRYGVTEFLEAADRYATFFVRHAEENHRDWRSDMDAWLVDDYGSRDGRKTHTSLNHQLCEILFLRQMADETGNSTYRKTADALLAGVTAVGLDWLTMDGNLWYSILRDGTIQGQDYPTLTYNDLFKLQAYLEERGERNKMLDDLMASKRAWMDRNGVTDYLQ